MKSHIVLLALVACSSSEGVSTPVDAGGAGPAPGVPEAGAAETGGPGEPPPPTTNAVLRFVHLASKLEARAVCFGIPGGTWIGPTGNFEYLGSSAWMEVPPDATTARLVPPGSASCESVDALATPNGPLEAGHRYTVAVANTQDAALRWQLVPELFEAPSKTRIFAHFIHLAPNAAEVRVAQSACSGPVTIWLPATFGQEAPLSANLRSPGLTEEFRNTHFTSSTTLGETYFRTEAHVCSLDQPSQTVTTMTTTLDGGRVNTYFLADPLVAGDPPVVVQCVDIPASSCSKL